jgi:DNA mismatch repair ATPase MutS
MPVSKSIMEELMKEDKEIRLLTYKILVEKFNQKYNNLSGRQKDVLNNYIISISDTTKLNQYVNAQLTEIKSEIQTISKKVTDKVVKIKLDEVVKLIQPVTKIKDETIAGLLQYIDLIDELNKVHK